MPNPIVLKDKIIGHWTVDETRESRLGKDRAFLCVCVCGTQKYVRVHILNRGSSRSCGCRRGESNTIHGLTGHPIRSTWKAMKSRCLNSKDRGFANYGGRGIKICERWLSFAAFAEDMLPKWRPGLSIERKDNNLGYYLENCSWETDKSQQRNRRVCVYLDSEWGKITLAEASERTGIPYSSLRYRAKTKQDWDEIISGYRPHNG